MQDRIIQEVEETREEIARRFNYDVKKIAAYLRKQAADRRATDVKTKVESESSPPAHSSE